MEAEITVKNISSCEVAKLLSEALVPAAAKGGVPLLEL